MSVCPSAAGHSVGARTPRGLIPSHRAALGGGGGQVDAGLGVDVRGVHVDGSGQRGGGVDTPSRHQVEWHGQSSAATYYYHEYFKCYQTSVSED